MTQPPPNPRERMREAVHDVLAQVKEQQHAASAEAVEQRRRAERRGRLKLLWLAGAAGFLFAALAYALPRARAPFAPPSGALAERHAQASLDLAARLVEQYRRDHDRLPDSLVETGVRLPGVTFRRDGAAYELSVTVEGRVQSHRAGPAAGTP